MLSLNTSYKDGREKSRRGIKRSFLTTQHSLIYERGKMLTSEIHLKT